MQKLVLTLAVTLAAAALAGCGGSDALSKDDFIAEGDRLCAVASQEADALGVPSTRADVERIGAVFRGLVVDLRELEPPGGDRAAVSALLRDYERGVSLIERDLGTAAAQGRDPETVETPEGWRLLERSSKAAQAYGFTVCGH